MCNDLISVHNDLLSWEWIAGLYIPSLCFLLPECTIIGVTHIAFLNSACCYFQTRKLRFDFSLTNNHTKAGSDMPHKAMTSIHHIASALCFLLTSHCWIPTLLSLTKISGRVFSLTTSEGQRCISRNARRTFLAFSELLSQLGKVG